MYSKHFFVKLCYFVLGMHRSGTSTIAGILNILGINAGSHLVEPQECNPKGFFENAAILDFNERLLHFLCADWSDTLMIPENWWKNDLVVSFYSELQTILENEFNASNEILIKDPRICVLLPFYLLLFSKMGVGCRFVIIFRNPLDVAASLEYRDNFNAEHAQLLWMDYVTKSELYTQGFSRIFIWFPELVGDPVGISRMLRNKWNIRIRKSVEAEKKILDFVDPQLMHFRSRMVAKSIPEIKMVYNVLLKMRNGAEADNCLKIIEQAGNNFRQVYGFYQGVSSNPEARLIMKTLAGSKTSTRKPIHYGRNLMEFDLTHTDDIVSMVFKPCNLPVCIMVNSIGVMEKHGSETIPLNWSIVQEVNENGIFVFDAENKEMIIQTSGMKGNSILVIDLNYVGFGMAACHVQQKTKSARMIHLEEKVLEMENLVTDLNARVREPQNESKEKVLNLKDRIIELQARIREHLDENEKLVEQVRALRSSYTWKTGFLILYPIKYVHRIISKIIQFST